MSFAFNTVILFLVIFSGLAARRAYYSQEFSKNYIKKNTFDELVGGIFIGILLQFAGILVLQKFGINFDFKAIGFLLLGAKDDANIAWSFSVLQNNIVQIVTYNITLISIAIIAGGSLRFLVRKFKLDRKFRFFRFDNEWHYILSGEIQEFPSTKIKSERISAKRFGNKYLNVLTKVDDHFVIYTGFLVQAFLSNDGGLDLICLDGAKKKIIRKEDDSPQTREHPMNVDLLVIPYSQIINLSVTYFVLEKLNPTSGGLRGFWKKAMKDARALIVGK